MPNYRHFKLTYFIDPRKYFPNPSQEEFGIYLMIHGIQLLLTKQFNSCYHVHDRINNVRAVQQSLAGFKYLYGLMPEPFFKNNFYTKGRGYYQYVNHNYCNTQEWLKIVFRLQKQLHQVRNVRSRSQLSNYRCSCLNIRRNPKRTPHSVIHSKVRERLRPYQDCHNRRFQATIGRLGYRNFNDPYRKRVRSILLKNVTYHHNLLAEHLWIPYYKQLLQKFHSGYRISIRAKVGRYVNHFNWDNLTIYYCNYCLYGLNDIYRINYYF